MVESDAKELFANIKKIFTKKGILNMSGQGEIFVKKFADERSREWDKYVNNNPNGTFFHLSGWKNVLEKTYKYKAHYIFAEQNEEICGVLPLFRVNNLLAGRTVVSLPFCVYGGVCADNKHSEELLIDEAKKITIKEKANYLELRHRYNLEIDMPKKDLYSTFIGRLPDKDEECLQKLPRKARAAARKAINYNLTTEIGADFIKEFYDVYAISVRNLGSPVVPYSFFENILKEFEQNTSVLMVKHKGKPISGVVTFLYKDTVMPYYSGSLPQYLKLQPNDFMYLKLMEAGVKKGYKFFDFGRSKKGTGTYKFKELFGFKAQPLYYQYFLNNITQIPDVSPMNPKLSIAINIWRKLPVCVTKIIGPKIVKITPP